MNILIISLGYITNISSMNEMPHSLITHLLFVFKCCLIAGVITVSLINKSVVIAPVPKMHRPATKEITKDLILSCN